jgi:hypothetical protein
LTAVEALPAHSNPDMPQLASIPQIAQPHQIHHEQEIIETLTNWKRESPSPTSSGESGQEDKDKESHNFQVIQDQQTSSNETQSELQSDSPDQKHQQPPRDTAAEDNSLLESIHESAHPPSASRTQEQEEKDAEDEEEEDEDEEEEEDV